MSDHKKKILVLNGSPKREKSTTMCVTRAFVQGIINTTDAECEYINISDLKIKPCTGCLSCWGRTAGECVIHTDDIDSVKKKILGADYVIESYPLYFFGMPGEMKLFCDRMLGMMHAYCGQKPPTKDSAFHKFRYPNANRRFAIISSCAFSETEGVYDSLLTQYNCICGKENYTAILCPQLKTLVDLGQGGRMTRYLKKFTDAGELFAAQGRLDDECLKKLSTPPFSEDTYKLLLDKFWESQKEGSKND